MNTTLRNIIILVVTLAAGVAAGFYLSPQKTVTTETIKYVDRVVEKKVYLKDTSTKKNTTTIKLVTVKPDGTRTEETRVVNNDTILVNQSGESNSDSTKVVDKHNQTVVESKKMDTVISLAAKSDFRSGMNYGVSVNKSILGPVYLGAFGFQDGQAGLSLGLGF